MSFRTKLRTLLKTRVQDKYTVERLLEELLEEIQNHTIDFEDWVNECVTDNETTKVLYHKFLKDGNRNRN